MKAVDLLSTDEETLRRAIRFYSMSPDGQYDEIAEAAIKLVLKHRQVLCDANLGDLL